MAELITTPITLAIFLLQGFIIIDGIRTYHRVAGSMRWLVLLLLAATALMTARTALHFVRMLLELGVITHLLEQILLLLGFGVLAAVTIRIQRIMQGE